MGIFFFLGRIDNYHIMRIWNILVRSKECVAEFYQIECFELIHNLTGLLSMYFCILSFIYFKNVPIFNFRFFFLFT